MKTNQPRHDAQSNTPKISSDIPPELTPRTPDELHAYIRTHLDISVSRTPLVQGHDAPFDYVSAAFFGPAPGESPDLVVWANRGGGKTFLGAVATALDLLFKPGIQVRLLAGSVEQAQKMYAHLRALFERPALETHVDGKITEKRLRLSNGSAAEILAQSQASVRGTRVQKIRCDEVELFDPDIWDAVQLATRSAQCGPAQVRGAIEALSTMHRPHGLMARLVEEGAANRRRRLFKWGVVDVLGPCGPEHVCQTCALHPECMGRAKERSPGACGHMSVEDAVTMKKRVSLSVWNSEMLGLRPQRSDCVFETFSAGAHVVEEEPRLDEPGEAERGAKGPPPALLVAAMDFGFRAPTVILWGVLRDGVLTIVDEHVRRNIVFKDHVATLLEHPRGRPSFTAIDPAGRQVNGHTGTSSASMLKDAGLRPRWRIMSIHEGLELVRARLTPADGSPPRLRIHRRCVELIRAMETYHYDAGKPESLVPEKDGPDHAVDALRYLVSVLDRPHQTCNGVYVGA